MISREEFYLTCTPLKKSKQNLIWKSKNFTFLVISNLPWKIGRSDNMKNTFLHGNNQLELRYSFSKRACGPAVSQNFKCSFVTWASCLNTDDLVWGPSLCISINYLRYGHRWEWSLFGAERAWTAWAHYIFLFPSPLSSNLSTNQQVPFIITLALLSFYIRNIFF